MLFFFAGGFLAPISQNSLCGNMEYGILPLHVCNNFLNYMLRCHKVLLS